MSLVKLGLSLAVVALVVGLFAQLFSAAVDSFTSNLDSVQNSQEK